MFAPPVTETSRKTPASLASRHASQRSLFAARLFASGAVEQEHPLQSAIGNQATLRLLAQPGIHASSPRNSLQAKLAVGPVDDPLEYEADRIADHVMRMPALDSGNRLLQRKCGACKEEEEQEKKVMRMESPGSPVVSGTVPPSVQSVLHSSGRPLDTGIRAGFESRFGYDFSRVRIHADSDAARSARDVGALAYTVGSHVAFGEGKYRPATMAGQYLLAHELTHVVQQDATPLALQRDEDPKANPGTGGTAPATCGIACTDPAFVALSAADREAKFNQECPAGYPKDKTFFGQPIPAESLPKLRNKLLEAAAKAKRAMCLDGQDPNAYHLDRAITTYPTHSPGEEKAVDIDVQGQPYIMHEHNEADVDKDIGPVYNRIQYWSHYTKSIIPKGITSVGRGKGGATARTWTNPETGKQEATTTAELYDKLKVESLAMTEYFNLLLLTDADLKIALEAFLIFTPDPVDTVAKLEFPTDYTDADTKTFRQRIADDYRLVGGSKAQLESFAGKQIADASATPKALASAKEDRPFAKGAVAGATQKSGAPDPAANRRPELGFIVLPKEVVVALTEVGLVWGAIDFGPESGDVMHFDCRNIC